MSEALPRMVVAVQPLGWSTASPDAIGGVVRRLLDVLHVAKLLITVEAIEVTTFASKRAKEKLWLLPTASIEETHEAISAEVLRIAEEEVRRARSGRPSSDSDQHPIVERKES